MRDGQTSVAERTLVRPIPAVSTSVSAPQTAQLNPQPVNQRGVHRSFVGCGPGGWPGDEGIERQLSGPPGSRGSFRRSTHGTKGHFENCCCAITRRPETFNAGRPKARQKDAVSSSRQTQHSVAPQTAPNVVERFFSRLTAAIEHVWPPQRLPANQTSRVSGNDPPGSLS